METAATRIEAAKQKLQDEINTHTEDPIKRELYMEMFSHVFILLSEGQHVVQEFSKSPARTALAKGEYSKDIGDFVGNMNHFLGTAKSSIRALFMFKEGLK